MKNKVLLIGTGSIARRHLKNILKIDKTSKISVYSKDEMRARKFVKEFKYKINVIKNLFKKNNFSHIVIASSTNTHNKYLKLFADKSKNIYCEKPIPYDKDFNFINTKKFLKSYSSQIKIGYQLRHNPAIKFIKKELKKRVNKKLFLIKLFCGQNLKDWRKNSNYKKLFSAGNKNYGSVYWELSHEIDLVNYIIGRPNLVYSNHKNTNNLKIEVNDLSNTILNFKNKSISCSISLEMISPILYRKLIIVTLSNYYELDLVKNIVIKKNKKKTQSFKFKSDRNKMFEDYMSNFLSNKKYSASFPFSNLQDGINTTKIIKAMESSNKFGQIIKI